MKSTSKSDHRLIFLSISIIFLAIFVTSDDLIGPLTSRIEAAEYCRAVKNNDKKDDNGNNRDSFLCPSPTAEPTIEPTPLPTDIPLPTIPLPTSTPEPLPTAIYGG